MVQLYHAGVTTAWRAVTDLIPPVSVWKQRGEHRLARHKKGVYRFRRRVRLASACRRMALMSCCTGG